MKKHHNQSSPFSTSTLCFLAFLLMVSAHTLDAKEVCNQTATKVYFSYAYKEIPSEFNMVGWYQIEAGECINLRNSLDDVYYGYGNVSSSDPVAQYLNAANTTFSGSQKDNDPFLCTNGTNAFHYSESNADQNCDKRRFFEMNGKGRLTLVSTVGAEEYGISSLEDAKHIANAINGQLLYDSDTANDAKGVPFRVGIEIIQDEASVYVNKVYAGLPAAMILRPGDRLMEINSHPIITPFDFIFELSRIGQNHSPDDRQKNLKVGFYRWYSLEEDPVYYEANLPLVYMEQFDLREKNEGEALIASAYDSVMLGFGSNITCTVAYLYDRLLLDRTHSQASNGCVNRFEKRLAQLRERNSGIYTAGDFGGAMFSPRFFLKAFGKYAGRRIATRATIGFADEAVQGVITVLGQKSSNEEISPPELAQVAAVSGLMGAAISLVTKK